MTWGRVPGDDRGVSPAVGVSLLIAVTITLVAASTTVFFGPANAVAPPQAAFSLEHHPDGVRVTHDGGDSIDGNNLRFAGAAKEGQTLGDISERKDSTVVTGDSAVVDATTGGDLMLIWEAPNSDDSFILFEKPVPTAPPSGGDNPPADDPSDPTEPSDPSDPTDSLTDDGPDCSNETVICDWYDLDNMHGFNNASKDYVLGADLNASTDGYDDVVADPANGFEPIGIDSGGFSGSFDGQGHTISDLRLNRTHSFVGLFSRLSKGGYNVTFRGRTIEKGSSNKTAVKNLTIENATVSGLSDVGVVAGMNSYQNINNVTVVDSTVDGADDTGGLVGSNVGTGEAEIRDISVTAEVTGTSQVGIVAGENNGAIANASGYGTVRASSSAADPEWFGGLVGQNNYGSITDSYSTADVEAGGANAVGGLVGGEIQGASITDSYATGAVSGDTNVGGIAGEVVGSSTVKDAYWDSESTCVSNAAGTSDSDSTVSATGLTTAEMTGNDAESNMGSLDFDDIWTVVGGEYPELQTAGPGS